MEISEVYIRNHPFNPDVNHFIYIEKKYDKQRNIRMDEVAETQGVLFLPRLIRETLGCEVEVFYENIMPNIENIYAPIYNNVWGSSIDSEWGMLHYANDTYQLALVYTYFDLEDIDASEIDFREVIEVMLEAEEAAREDKPDPCMTTQLITNRNFYVDYGNSGKGPKLQDIVLKTLKMNSRSKNVITNLPKLSIKKKDASDITGLYSYSMCFKFNDNTSVEFSLGPNQLAIYLALIENRKGVEVAELEDVNGFMKYYYGVANMPDLKKYGEARYAEIHGAKRIVKTSVTNMVNQINTKIKEALGEKYSQYCKIFEICKDLNKIHYFVIAPDGIINLKDLDQPKKDYERF